MGKRVADLAVEWWGGRKLRPEDVGRPSGTANQRAIGYVLQYAAGDPAQRPALYAWLTKLLRVLGPEASESGSTTYGGAYLLFWAGIAWIAGRRNDHVILALATRGFRALLIRWALVSNSRGQVGGAGVRCNDPDFPERDYAVQTALGLPLAARAPAGPRWWSNQARRALGVRILQQLLAEGRNPLSLNQVATLRRILRGSADHVEAPDLRMPDTAPELYIRRHADGTVATWMPLAINTHDGHRPAVVDGPSGMTSLQPIPPEHRHLAGWKDLKAWGVEVGGERTEVRRDGQVLRLSPMLVMPGRGSKGKLAAIDLERGYTAPWTWSGELRLPPGQPVSEVVIRHGAPQQPVPDLDPWREGWAAVAGPGPRDGGQVEEPDEVEDPAPDPATVNWSRVAHASRLAAAAADRKPPDAEGAREHLRRALRMASG